MDKEDIKIISSFLDLSISDREKAELAKGFLILRGISFDERIMSSSYSIENDFRTREDKIDVITETYNKEKNICIILLTDDTLIIQNDVIGNIEIIINNTNDVLEKLHNLPEIHYYHAIKKAIIKYPERFNMLFKTLFEGIVSLKNIKPIDIEIDTKELINKIEIKYFITKTAFTMNKKNVKIFVSYSSKDRELRELLVEGLQEHLQHRRVFEYSQWTDKQIDLGANWQDEINFALKTSDAVLLLVSSSFAASKFINNQELAHFFQRKKEEKYLIMPVLLRSYNFSEFELISQLNFFKTYHNEYGFNKPIERNKLFPFDKLGNNDASTDEQLNLYYKNLADFVHNAVVNFYSQQDENKITIE